jgi:UDPglucose 6-dehydrogenase
VVDVVVQVNEARKRAMGRKVLKAMGGDPRGRTVAVLGLTFKPNTDDMREAPSLSIIRALQDAGCKIRAHDPEGEEQARELLNDVTFADDAYEAVQGADAVALVTEWDEYRRLDLKRLATTMATPVFVDLRNVYTRAEAEAAGFVYEAVGRGAKESEKA